MKSSKSRNLAIGDQIAVKVVGIDDGKNDLSRRYFGNPNKGKEEDKPNVLVASFLKEQ